MRYSVDPGLFARHPHYVRAVVVGRGLANSETVSAEALGLLRTAESLVRNRPDLREPALHDRIASWREAYAAFGARPSKYLSSIEALVRRVRRGDPLPTVNTLVTLTNVISLHYLVPAGGHDIGQARGPLRLGMATGHETFQSIGESESERPAAGEVIYADGDVAICRRWTWRQAEHTRLRADSSYAAINIDGLPPVTRAETAEMAEEMRDLLARYCGGASEVLFLDAGHLSIEV